MAPPLQAPDARRAELPDGSQAVPRRNPAGLATLEWLLVVAAAGGFAAVMAVGLQALIDDASSVGDSADARLIDAGITAARISDNSIAALIALENSSGDPEQRAAALARLAALSGQCEALETAYLDVVESADWAWLAVPVEIVPLTPTTVADTEPPPTTDDSETTRDPVITALPVETTLAPPGDDAGAPTLTSGRWVCQIGHRVR